MNNNSDLCLFAAYRNWMNSMGVSPFVHYIYSDLADALVIFQLYDFIKPGKVNWDKVHRKFNKMKANFEKIGQLAHGFQHLSSEFFNKFIIMKACVLIIKI